MTVNIEYDTEKALDLDYKKIIESVIDKAVEDSGCPYETEVNVTLTDNDEIKKNKQRIP